MYLSFYYNYTVKLNLVSIKMVFNCNGKSTKKPNPSQQQFLYTVDPSQLAEEPLLPIIRHLNNWISTWRMNCPKEL